VGVGKGGQAVGEGKWNKGRNGAYEKFSHQDKFPSGALSWWEFCETIHFTPQKLIKVFGIACFTFLKSFLIRTNSQVMYYP